MSRGNIKIITIIYIQIILAFSGMQLLASEIHAIQEPIGPPVDNDPPLDFHIGINENSLPFEYGGEWINDSRPRIDFYTTDLLSGIDYIEFNIDSGPTIKDDCPVH